MSKAYRIIAMVFALIGLVFLLTCGILQAVYRQQTQGCIPATGSITGFTGNSYPEITYTFNGEQYSFASSSRSSFQKIGDQVSLLVDPETAKAFDGTLPLLSTIFGSIGAVMMCVASVVRLAERRRQLLADRLRTYGRRVTVEITAVKENSMVQVNTHHPWRVYAECRHPLTGQPLQLHSHDLWQTGLQPGDKVDVLFDPDNERRYVFDIGEG